MKISLEESASHIEPEIIVRYREMDEPLRRSDKPIHKRAMAVRTCIHFGVLLALVLFCAWQFEWFSFNHVPSVLTFLLLFFTVYYRLVG